MGGVRFAHNNAMRSRSVLSPFRVSPHPMNVDGGYDGK